MELLDTPAGRLAYDERGSGPETLVMLPSGSHSRRDFDELRALLPTQLRTVALDWPAHGESPAGTLSGSAMDLARVAEYAVERLAPNGAVVLGNSVGGFAAAHLAVHRPELVRGLVVVDGGGFTGRPLQLRAFCALMARPGFLRSIYPAFSALYMRVRSDADRRAREAAIATTRTDVGVRAVSELWHSFASPEHDLRDEAPSISAPTLIVWGKRDPVISARIGKRLARAIPGAKLVLMSTGHLPHTSDPQGFATQLMPFLEDALTEPREVASAH